MTTYAGKITVGVMATDREMMMEPHDQVFT